MVGYLHLTVYGLPAATTPPDVVAYFRKHVPDSEPIVKAFVSDLVSGELSAVVILKTSNARAAASRLETLSRDAPLTTSAGTDYIGVDVKCRRLTVLARARPDAAFESASLSDQFVISVAEWTQCLLRPWTRWTRA